MKNIPIAPESIHAGAPDIQGPKGDAWVYKLKPINAAQTACLKQWIVCAPWAHIAWHSYHICVVHLREIEGATKPLLYDPRATHEVMVTALDPTYPVIQGQNCHLLMPPNYMEQFRAGSDAEAVKKVEETIKEIVDGELNPDSDFRMSWKVRYPYSNPGRLLIGAESGTKQ